MVDPRAAPLQMVLEFESASPPISGRLGGPATDGWSSFTGWIGLLAVLEEALGRLPASREDAGVSARSESPREGRDIG